MLRVDARASASARARWRVDCITGDAQVDRGRCRHGVGIRVWIEICQLDRRNGDVTRCARHHHVLEHLSASYPLAGRFHLLGDIGRIDFEVGGEAQFRCGHGSDIASAGDLEPEGQGVVGIDVRSVDRRRDIELSDQPGERRRLSGRQRQHVDIDGIGRDHDRSATAAAKKRVVEESSRTALHAHLGLDGQRVQGLAARAGGEQSHPPNHRAGVLDAVTNDLLDARLWDRQLFGPETGGGRLLREVVSVNIDPGEDPIFDCDRLVDVDRVLARHGGDEQVVWCAAAVGSAGSSRGRRCVGDLDRQRLGGERLPRGGHGDRSDVERAHRDGLKLILDGECHRRAAVCHLHRGRRA